MTPSQELAQAMLQIFGDIIGNVVFPYLLPALAAFHLVKWFWSNRRDGRSLGGATGSLGTAHNTTKAAIDSISRNTGFTGTAEMMLGDIAAKAAAKAAAPQRNEWTPAPTWENPPKEPAKGANPDPEPIESWEADLS